MKLQKHCRIAAMLLWKHHSIRQRLHEHAHLESPRDARLCTQLSHSALCNLHRAAQTQAVAEGSTAAFNSVAGSLLTLCS